MSNKTKLKNVNIIDVKNISFTLFEKNIAISNVISIDQQTFYNTLYPAILEIAEAQLNAQEMQNLINDAGLKFDLLIVEGYFPTTLMINARFHAPVVVVNPLAGVVGNYNAIGAVIDPIVFPGDVQYTTWNLSIWNKISTIFNYVRLRLKEWEVEQIETMIKKYFGDNAPKMSELKKNIQMMLVAVHHFWDHNRPVPPNVFYLGALHLRSPQPLDESIKTYMDNSKNGVIYMSLGSIIKSSDLPPETTKLILKVFAELPYDCIWKWDHGRPPGKPPNVRFEKWLPQSDMLYHPKMKAFITHAGLQSTHEAIAANVPLIGLPAWCDQPLNAALYEKHEIGIKLHINNLNEEELKNAIQEVAENPRYRNNIAAVARIMEIERSGALEKALRWINHTAVYGTPQLRSPLAEPQRYREMLRRRGS